MNRFLPLAVALAVAGTCCVIAAYFCHFYYTLYRGAVSDVERQMGYFEQRLAALETHKSRDLTPVHVMGIISTTDQPADEFLSHLSPSSTNPTIFFETTNAKAGPNLRPEFRLPFASTNQYEYDVHVEGQFGNVADAWLSLAEPYSYLSAIEKFSIYCPNKTNTLRLVVRLKPNASVKMRFYIVLLCQR